jgi:phosphoserine aminotransferase
MTTTARTFNFSAGPAALPLPVLEEAQRHLLSLPGVAASVLEMSHRSKQFDEILAGAIADIRALADVGSNYRVLLLQGGASLQFSMVPANLLRAGSVADYILTDSWSEKAAHEASKVGPVHVAGSTKAQSFSRLPRPGELTFTPEAAYVHLTSNNTIVGTQWHTLPDVGDVPLVNDTSSDMFSRPIDVARHGLIYASAQKNLGPSGVTLVIVREDLLERSRDALPTMLNYRVHAEHNSLYNTPPTFGIYILGLTMRWLRRQGGLAAIGERNRRKAMRLYAEIDRTGYFRGTAHRDDRSLMNVTFRLPTPQLDDVFVRAATAAGLERLRGHRSVGGIRASIYNGFPHEGVEALVDFMREFERTHG